MASFAGFAPADNPRIVGVVVIDEPPQRLHYGGQIAAPVFREVVLDLIRRSARDLLTDDIEVDPPAVT